MIDRHASFPSSSSSSTSSSSSSSSMIIPLMLRPLQHDDDNGNEDSNVNISTSFIRYRSQSLFYPKSRIFVTLSTTALVFLLLVAISHCTMPSQYRLHIHMHMRRYLHTTFPSLLHQTNNYNGNNNNYNTLILHYRDQVYRQLRIWRTAAAFQVTRAMRASIAMSLVLGVALGIGVGVISGLEPAVVIGVSASMAMGCVFVMSFAILHGVSAVRALVFAMFVSACMPLGFGVGVGIGIMIAIVFGLEDPDELREKTRYFVTHFAEFVQEVVVFSIDILKLR